MLFRSERSEKAKKQICVQSVVVKCELVRHHSERAYPIEIGAPRSRCAVSAVSDSVQRPPNCSMVPTYFSGIVPINVLGAYIFGKRCLMAVKTATNRTAVVQVGTKADRIDAREAEPRG